jgi:hypothetical protein
MTELLIALDSESVDSTDSTIFPLATFGITPASTDTITFDYTGTFSGTINFSPVALTFAEDYLEVDLPPSLTYTNQPFSGTFTVPNDPAQFTDGDINLDFLALSSGLGFSPDDSFVDILSDFGIPVSDSVVDILDTLGITDANSAVGFLDDLFNLELDGSGTLVTGAESTTFDIDYFDDTNTIVIDEFNPDVVAGSLVGSSTITTQVTFSVDLVLSEFVEVTNSLGIDLPSNVDSFLSLAQLLGINELEIASGTFNSQINTIPISVVN